MLVAPTVIVTATPTVTPTAPPDPSAPEASGDAGVPGADAAVRPARWQGAEPVPGATGTPVVAMDPNAQVHNEPVAWSEPDPSAAPAPSAASAIPSRAIDTSRDGKVWALIGTNPGALAVWAGRPRQGVREPLTDVFVRAVDPDGRFVGPVRRAAELTGQLESLEGDARGDSVWVAGRALRSVGVFVHAFAIRRDAARVGFVQRLDVVPRAEARETFVRVVADPDGGAWVLHSGREHAPTLQEMEAEMRAAHGAGGAPGGHPVAHWFLNRMGTDHRPVGRGELVTAEHYMGESELDFVPSSANVLWARDALYVSLAVGRDRTLAAWRGAGLLAGPGDGTQCADSAVALPPATPDGLWRLLRIRAADFNANAIVPTRPWQAAVTPFVREPAAVREPTAPAWAPLLPASFVCVAGRPRLRIPLGSTPPASVDIDPSDPDVTGWAELLRRFADEGPSAPRCLGACGLFDSAVAWTGRTLVRFDGERLHRYGCPPNAAEPAELTTP